MRRASIIIMLLAALLMTASCTVGPDNAPEEPETPVEEPGANPGGGGGGGSAGGGSTSNADRENKEFIINSNVNALVANGLAAAMNGNDESAKIVEDSVTWVSDPEIAASALGVTIDGRGTLSFTVAFTEFGDKDASGNLDYHLTVSDSKQVTGFTASAPEEDGLKQDGHSIDFHFDRPAAIDDVTVETDDTGISFSSSGSAQIEIDPVPAGVISSVSVDGEEYRMNELYDGLPTAKPTYADMPKNLYSLMNSVGNLSMYISYGSSQSGVDFKVGTKYSIVDFEELPDNTDEPYCMFKAKTQENTEIEIFIDKPVDFEYAGKHIYIDGTFDMDMKNTYIEGNPQSSGGVDLDDFMATVIDENGNQETTDPISGRYDASLIMGGGGDSSSEIIIGNRVYGYDEFTAFRVLNSLVASIYAWDSMIAFNPEPSEDSSSMNGGFSLKGAYEVMPGLAGEYSVDDNGIYTLEGTASLDESQAYVFKAAVKVLDGGSPSGQNAHDWGILQGLTFDRHPFSPEDVELLRTLAASNFAQPSTGGNA